MPVCVALDCAVADAPAVEVPRGCGLPVPAAAAPAEGVPVVLTATGGLVPGRTAIANAATIRMKNPAAMIIARRDNIVWPASSAWERMDVGCVASARLSSSTLHLA